jgi:hypothetical protein
MDLRAIQKPLKEKNVEVQAPSFELATEWLNGRVTATDEGPPTLVHFWSVSSETAIARLNVTEPCALGCLQPRHDVLRNAGREEPKPSPV